MATGSQDVRAADSRAFFRREPLTTFPSLFAMERTRGEILHGVSRGRRSVRGAVSGRQAIRCDLLGHARSTRI